MEWLYSLFIEHSALQPKYKNKIPKKHSGYYISFGDILYYETHESAMQGSFGISKHNLATPKTTYL